MNESSKDIEPKISGRTSSYYAENDIERIENTFQKIFAYIISAFALIFPLTFLPFFGNSLLGGKMVILGVFAILLIFLTLAKVVAQRKILWGRSVFDIPILLIALSFLLSAVLTTSYAVSLFGNYGSFFLGVGTFISMLVVYFSIVAHIKDGYYLNMIKYSFVLSLVIVVIFALLNYFGIYLLPAEIAKNKNFNLIGSSELVGFLSVLSVVILFFGLLDSKKEGRYSLFAVPILILSLGVGIFGELSALIVGTVALMLYLYIGKLKVDKTKTFLLTLSVVIGLGVGLGVRFFVKNEDFVRNVKLDPKTSWVVTGTTMTNYPIWGSGPGTFSNDFTRFKPKWFSSNQYANLRFNYPYSDYMLYLSELGILGLLSFVFLFYVVVKRIRSVREIANEEGEGGSNSLAGSYIVIVSLGVGLMFLNLGMVGFAFFVMMLAALGKELYQVEKIPVIEGQEDEIDSNKFGMDMNLLPHYVIGILLLAFMVASIYFVPKVSTAEAEYKKAIDAIQSNDPNAALRAFDNTINKFGYYDQYYRDYVSLNVAIANSLALDENGNLKKKEDITKEQGEEIQQRYDFAINLINKAIRLNPQNALNHVARGDIFNSIIAKATDPATAGRNAIDSYKNAEFLDPNSVIIKMRIGSVYYAFGEYQLAAQYFYDVTELDPTYANGYYNLSYALKNLGDYQNAYIAMQNVFRLVPDDSEDKKKVEEELKSLEELVKKQQEQQQKVDTGIKVPAIEEDSENENPSDFEGLTEPEEAPKVPEIQDQQNNNQVQENQE